MELRGTDASAWCFYYRRHRTRNKSTESSCDILTYVNGLFAFVRNHCYRSFVYVCQLYKKQTWFGIRLKVSVRDPSSISAKISM